MSGQDILIEQLRAEVERLRDDRADLQERCNRLTGERNAALLLMKDEEARAEKAERERDQAIAERDARPDISPEDADGTIVVCALTNPAPSWPGGHEAALRIANALRAHAAKAVRP